MLIKLTAEIANSQVTDKKRRNGSAKERVMSDRTLRFRIKPLVFLASLGPAGWLVWAALTGNLSVNPLSDITNQTGVWAIRFVCVTLAITPVRKLTGWQWLARFRRMLGLYAFFYGTMHFLTYIVADRFAGLDFPNGIVSWTTAVALTRSIAADIYKRPFITVGFLAWLTMLPLAITSTAAWIRRLGGRTWNRLHKLVYATGVVAALHYWWLVKSDVRRPQVYAAVVLILLALRAQKLVWRVMEYLGGAGRLSSTREEARQKPRWPSTYDGRGFSG